MGLIGFRPAPSPCLPLGMILYQNKHLYSFTCISITGS